MMDNLTERPYEFTDNDFFCAWSRLTLVIKESLDKSRVPYPVDSLTEYMEETVLSGTASKLKDAPYTAAGKTGTAEYTKDKSKSHAGFVGFSNVEAPDLVVCFLVEGAGAGSDYAVPIAKKIFDAYFSE